MNKTEKFGIILIVFWTVLCLWAIFYFQERTNACEESGGEMVKTAGGYVCAEIRRVK